MICSIPQVMDGEGARYSEQLQQLRGELERTWQERLDAIAEFSSVVAEVPSMIPATADGCLLIQQAGTRMNRAIDAHAKAVQCYVDLVTRRSMEFRSGPVP